MVEMRFATALQMMLSLAYAEQEGVPSLSSSVLAEGLGTNASLVRKTLVPLVQTGLVKSTMGKHGGVRLGRPAVDISLREIHSAVLSEKKFFFSRPNVPHRCLVSSNIGALLEDLSTNIENSVLSYLGTKTLGQLLAEMHDRELNTHLSDDSAPKH